MSRSLLHPSIFIALFGVGCLESWKGTDGDGDGVSLADGDCWDSPEGPPGSNLSGDQIFPGAPDDPYDGIDADCAGNDDFDLDGDGYVTSEEHLGKETIGVADSGSNHVGIGDCWDDPDLPHDSPDHASGQIYTNVSGEQVTAAMVHPDQDDTWYDGPDQDCGGNDDFDQDGDGQRTDKTADQAGATGADCVDLHPDDNPDANLADLAAADIYSGAEELWYDGTDQDCSGVYNTGLEVDEVLSDCDFDGDGAPVADGPDVPDASVCRDYVDISRDCNDEDSTAKPDASVAEIFYNGVDDNCTPVLAGVPDTDGDADRDGHWSADYETLVTDVDASVDLDGVVFDDCWDDPDTTPAAYVGEDVRAFDAQGDPDDADSFTVLFAAGSLTAADVNPSATDRPYDGVDQDCAGDDTIDDEYDWDGDGETSMYQWYTDPDTSTVVAGADCMDCSADCATAEGDLLVLCEALCDNDAYVDIGTGGLVNPGGFESAEVNPDASDPLYDGTDQDCGRDIDFDDDGDYYATDPAAAIAQGEAREAYYYWDTIGFLYASDADCNDTDATINPGLESEEIWYDGEDTDCDGEDDYDQDYDGYVPDAYAGLKTYAAAPGAADRDDFEYTATGALPANDCNDDPLDDGAAYNPAAADTWYDGNDNDCAYDDDYDADADGYASEVQASAYGDTMHGSSVGVPAALTTDDCDDTTATVSPAEGEVWYDGVDMNCDEKDDFDADEDGHADDAYTSTYGPTTNEAGDIPGTGLLPVDDCNDTEDVVYTGAPDVWYDGIDHDCDERDDFDADEDGDAWDGTAYATTYQSTGTSSTYAVSGTGALTDTDCNDEEAGVNGNATDTWRDGVDQDCDGRDDYDIDEDGYVLDADVGLVTYQSLISDTDYVLASTGSLPGDDCVEDDASYNPDATDTWYDGLDHDCADNDDFDQDEDDHAAEGTTVAYTTTTHDGVAVAGTGTLPVDDCNDTEDVIYTGATDVWYDGIDHDCDERDDFDADEDLHASLDETYADTYQSTTADSAYLVASAGSLDVDDCNDTDPEVYGGTAITDDWYDGVDSNCDGLDDYDADEDGYVPDEYVGLSTYQSEDLALEHTVTGTGGLPGDDCVDDNDAYNPAATDTWYDGLDHDCADNDDWDRDEDGHAAEGTTVSYTTTTQDGTAVAGTGGLSVDDCNDEDDAVYTGAADAWYDGIDHDCDEADDYDQDADGYASLAQAGSYGTTYQSTALDAAYAVSGSGALSATDCNDEEAVIRPLATDTWRDGIDQDCGGNDDYDIDADGYVLDADVGLVTYQSAVSDPDYLLGATGSLPGDDCVEGDSAYNPAATDTWYDGLDHDCADDDDWDADVDGHAAEGTTVAYTTTTHDGSAVAGTGSLSVDDCNDTDSAVYTGATDAWYDGIDHDCDEADDFDQDLDGDAYDGATYTATFQDSGKDPAYVVAGTGALATDEDCNDTDAAVASTATDTWYDAVDSDCGGEDDFDADEDGYASELQAGAYATTYQSTSSQAGYILASTGSLSTDDCDDTASSVSPGASETWYDGVDQDCDEADDWDADADGHASEDYTATYTVTTNEAGAIAGTGTLSVDDCNDTEDDVSPSDTDSWYDGTDSDCGGEDDYDADADGYVPDAHSGLVTYQSYDDMVSTTYELSSTGSLPDGDCLDKDTFTYDGVDYNPGVTDTWYDGQDEDCAGDDDYDKDGDGFVRDSDVGFDTRVGLTLVYEGTGTNGNDCNDDELAFNPDATDAFYDGLDHDCDGADDYDQDLDGYVSSAFSGDMTYTDAAKTIAVAGTGTGLVDDCNDGDAAINSGATEVCDAGDVDEDCDGLADDDDGSVDPGTQTTYYTDADSDTYGLDGSGALYCDAPASTVLIDGDCDDSDSAIKPGATELVGDEVDQDCDTEELCYTDADNDGYTDDTTVVSTDIDCSGSGEGDTAVAALDPDCDDGNPAVNPGATEVCDASDVDEDCNGLADDDDSGVDAGSYTDWYTDGDSDGYGDEGAVAVSQCEAPSGTVSDNTDCDDGDEERNPGESEALDGKDNDCDDDYDEGVIVADSEYVLITEIMIDPDNVSDIFGEWFEIYNPNAFSITLDEDWVFYRSSGAGFNPPSELTVGPDEYVVLVRNSSTSVNGNVTGDYTYGGAGIGSLANGGDYLVAAYFDPDDVDTDTGDLTTSVTVDAVDWDAAGWTLTIPTGATLQLDNDGGYPSGAAADDDTVWCAATTAWDSGDFGSPGIGNEACP